jgi:3-hydroxyisobutyrate dehydrogenase
METIGFVGLGTIGSVVAKNICQRGYRLLLHDIRLEAVQPLINERTAAALSPAEVARECRIIFTSLPGPSEVEQVTLGSNGFLREIQQGTIYIDLSSSSPDLIRRIDKEFGARGSCALDAPLIVGKDGIANRSVQVLASGNSEAYEKVKALLEAFSDTVVYTGELGTGTIIKLAHNLVRRGIGVAIGEGIVLGAKAGVDPQLLWDCMHWGLDVQLRQLKKTFPDTVFSENFETPANFGIGLARKDVGLATELARKHDVPMPIAAIVEQVMIAAMNRGWSDQSTASLFRLQEEAAGITVRRKR